MNDPLVVPEHALPPEGSWGQPLTLPALTSTHPVALIARAVDAGRDITFVEKLMDLADRHERNEARRAFNAAIAQFRQAPPIITKDKEVGFEGKNGKAGTHYRHATLGQVAEKLGFALAPFGLSLRWTVEQPGHGIARVTCYLCHVAGHSESCTMEGPYDESGNKNKIQQVASTVTYLKRHTALAVCGTAVVDDPEDDDGAGGAPGDAPESHQPEQRVEAVRERAEPATKATQTTGTTAASASVAATPEDTPMMRTLKGRMARSNKTELDLRTKFGHGFDGVTVANINDMMEWARA